MTDPASEASILADRIEAGAVEYAKARYTQGPMFSMLLAAYLAGAAAAVLIIKNDIKETAP